MTAGRSIAHEPVVITGAQVATCLGASRRATWEAICAKRGGFTSMPALEQRPDPARTGGQAAELPADFAPELPREARYLRHVMLGALADAGLAPGAMPADHAGRIFGTTLHGMRAAGAFLRQGDPLALRHFLAGSTLRLAGGDLGFDAVASTTCSACSSGLGSVALAVSMLQSGRVDVMLAGGYDPVSEYAYAGFNSLRLIAAEGARPFARGRDGMVIGEGYAALVLERYGDAVRRGAEVLAVVAGFGESADAHHLTQPHPSGEGAIAAIRAAMEHAGAGPEEIDLVCAHATSTPDNDAGEYAALAAVLGERLGRLPVAALKSQLGHTLGGAGAVELVMAVMAMRSQVAPPTAMPDDAEIETGPLGLLREARETRICATLNLSLGFGGANTCVILRRRVPTKAPTLLTPTARPVAITGIGVVSPGAIGNRAFAELVLRRDAPGITADTGPIDDEALAGLINARRVRRMSPYVKLTLAATGAAVADAGLSADGSELRSASAILGSMLSSTTYSVDYYRQVVNEGMNAANPMLFAEGVPNAAAAHLSLMLGLRGACQTIIGTRTAALEALALAACRIESGLWERAIVSTAEEHHALLPGIYAAMGLHRGETPGRDPVAPFGGASGFVTGCGAVTFVLESLDAAARRGVSPWGMVEKSATAVNPLAQPRDPAAVARVYAALGRPDHVVLSANNTWLDAMEAGGVASEVGGAVTAGAMYGHTAEAFSTTPAMALAALLLTGRMPRLRGAGALPSGLLAATGEELVREAGVVASDFAGAAAGVRVSISQRHLQAPAGMA